jgi:Zn-dependent protease/predicted transcriptional regulator
MKWSWKIARVAGIDVYIHATFLLLIAWIGISAFLAGRNLLSVLDAVGFIIALFACVVLHEYGHALTARGYGIPTRDITLLPIGGLARLERMPEKPSQEFWVALAGPAINIVIAGLLFLILVVTGEFNFANLFNTGSGSFFQRLLAVNLSLALFNLIPAVPMDGGRVVRSVLAIWMKYDRATRIAATLGQGIALVFGFVGLFTNPFLLFIALFVWIGAAQESNLAQMKSSLSGIPISMAMLTDFHTLSTRDSLSKVVALIISGSQHDFPVLEDGKVVGILTWQNLLRDLAQFGQEGTVGRAMTCSYEVVNSNQMLEEVSLRLQVTGCRALPVVHDGELVGLITLENIGEFVMIRDALGGSGLRSTRR